MSINRAILSVSDKTGIIELAKALASRSIEIVSTGGTAQLLKKSGIPVVTVDAFTGSPEMLDGRVKTLHPKVHGGILAIRDNPAHKEQIKKYSLKLIDLVIINLYPFEGTIAKKGVTIEEAIENIDIGGPSMIRGAAKNYRFVTVVVDPADYQSIILDINNTGFIPLEKRRALAVKAFELTASYDNAITTYLRALQQTDGET